MHPYGEVMTETTRTPSREDLVSYHDAYFRPNAAYLIVVGDITNEAYAKAFTGSGNVPTSPSNVWRPPDSRSEIKWVWASSAVQSTINITQQVPFPPGHPDAAAIQLMNSILGGGAFSGRLMQNLREDKAFTYGARCALSAIQ